MVAKYSDKVNLRDTLRLGHRNFRILTNYQGPSSIRHVGDVKFANILVSLSSPRDISHTTSRIVTLASGYLCKVFGGTKFNVCNPLSAVDHTRVRRRFSTGFFNTRRLAVHLLPTVLPRNRKHVIVASSIVKLVSAPNHNTCTTDGCTLRT